MGLAAPDSAYQLDRNRVFVARTRSKFSVARTTLLARRALSRALVGGLEWKYTRNQVAQMVSFEANKAGALASENMTKMGITWVSFEGKRFEYKPAVLGEHYKLIVAATWEKVKQNPEVKKVLLSTGDLILKPDHHQEPNAPAAWHYHEILMRIRSELRKQDYEVRRGFATHDHAEPREPLPR